MKTPWTLLEDGNSDCSSDDAKNCLLTHEIILGDGV